MLKLESLKNLLLSKGFCYFVIGVSFIGYWVESDVLKTQNSLTSPPVFIWIERLIAGLLTYEFYLRSRDNPKYWKTNEGIIDLLGFIPFWIGFFVPIAGLDIIRSFRLLRLLKAYRYNDFMQKLGQSFRSQFRYFKILTFLTGTVFLFMTTIIFEIEKASQPDKFGSLFDTSWWTLVTMTTIGYGDQYPITYLGKLFSMICMVTSLACFAS